MNPMLRTRGIESLSTLAAVKSCLSDVAKKLTGRVAQTCGRRHLHWWSGWYDATTRIRSLSCHAYATLCLRRPQHSNTEIMNAKRVLELGSGLGLVGNSLARMGVGHVTVTDMPQQMELLRANVEANSGTVDISVEAAALLWGAPLERTLTGRDVIVAADLVYDEALVAPLANTVSKLLLGPGAALNACGLFALPDHRDFGYCRQGSEEVLSDYEMLFDMLAKEGLQTEQVASVPSA